MRRIWVAIILMLICAVLAVSEFSVVQKSCDYYAYMIDVAEDYISSREFSKADLYIQQTQSEWEKSQKTLNIFLLHEEADTITESLAQLREHAENKNKSEFISLSEKTKRQLLCLKQSELPDLENIM